MKKEYFLAISMILLCFSGCGNAEPKEQEALPAVQEEVEENEKVTEQEPLVENTQEPVADTETNVLQEYKHGFDYNLYFDSYTYEETHDNPIVLRFNYPYKAEWFSANSNYPSQYSFSNNKGTLVITSEIYEVTEDNKLIYVNPKFGGSQDEVSLEEKGEVDTIYGKAEIYFATEMGSDGSEWHREVAYLNTGDYTVTIFWSEYGVEEYRGEIENMISLLFTPIELTKDEVLVFDENDILVDSSYDLFMRVNLIGENYTQENVNSNAFGFNDLEKIGNWNKSSSSGDGKVYSLFGFSNYQNGDNLLITGDVFLYNYFFGGRSLVDIEEKAEVETPFGTAKVYYAVRKDTEEPMEEEVAIVNNRGTNIVINYSNRLNQYDGVYDGKLEELIPELFK